MKEVVLDGEVEDIVSEMRHDAEIDAWRNPDSALKYYADKIESCMEEVD